MNATVARGVTLVMLSTLPTLAIAALVPVLPVLLQRFHGVLHERWLGTQALVGPFVSFAYVLLGGALGVLSWRGPFLLYLIGMLVFIPCLWLIDEPPRAPVAADACFRRPFPWWVAFRVGTAVGGFVYRRLRTRAIERMLALVLVAYGIAYVGLWRSPNYWFGVPFDALGQFAGGLTVPVLVSWSLREIDIEHRGRGMGIWAACFFLGQFLSALVVTLIGHGRWDFLTSLGVVGLGCAAAAAALRAYRPAPV